MARFRHGQEDYYVGGHPLWQVLRGIFQMKERPFVLGGLFLILGYFWAMVKKMPAGFPGAHRVSPGEQMARLER